MPKFHIHIYCLQCEKYQLQHFIYCVFILTLKLSSVSLSITFIDFNMEANSIFFIIVTILYSQMILYHLVINLWTQSIQDRTLIDINVIGFEILRSAFSKERLNFGLITVWMTLLFCLNIERYFNVFLQFFQVENRILLQSNVTFKYINICLFNLILMLLRIIEQFDLQRCQEGIGVNFQVVVFRINEIVCHF